MLVDRAQNAEPIDHLVGDEVGGWVARLAVMVVVITLSCLDVVGQRGGDHRLVVAVTFDQVGNVVAHHPAEPADLIALMSDVVADVGGGGDTDRDVVGVASSLCGCALDKLAGPLHQVRVGQLENEAVAFLSDQGQCFRAVSGTPHGEVVTLLDPGNGEGLVVEFDLIASHQGPDDIHRRLHRGQGLRLQTDVAQRGIASSHTANRSAARHLVQRGEQRRDDGPIPSSRIGDHRPHDHVLSSGQHAREDDERLLPQDVGVEGPGVGESILFSALGQFDDP